MTNEEEKKKEEGAGEETARDNNENGNAQKTPGYLEQVEKLRDEMKAEREEAQKLRDELRELRAKEMISGEATYTGNQKKEMSPKEYIDSLAKGQIPKE